MAQLACIRNKSRHTATNGNVAVKAQHIFPMLWMTIAGIGTVFPWAFKLSCQKRLIPDDYMHVIEY